jgi:hypothetical protein
VPTEKTDYLGALAQRRSHSVTTTITALRFLVEYGRTCDRIGEEIEIEQFAEEVGVSRSQAFRRQAAFRKCFPKDDVLTLWEHVKPTLDSSTFSTLDPKMQAVFLASLKVTHS